MTKSTSGLGTTTSERRRQSAWLGGLSAMSHGQNISRGKGDMMLMAFLTPSEARSATLSDGDCMVAVAATILGGCARTVGALLLWLEA